MQPQAGLRNHYCSLILPDPKLSIYCWDKILSLILQLKDSIIVEENLYSPYVHFGCKAKSLSEDYTISYYLI